MAACAGFYVSVWVYFWRVLAGVGLWPKVFEPKGDENIGDGYTRHQNPIAALSCSWLLYFLGEKHASATSSSRLTSEECWCDTRKPRQSGSTQDCAVQQVFWSMVRKWGECSIEVGAVAGLSHLPEQFGGIGSLRTAVLLAFNLNLSQWHSCAIPG